MPDKPYTGKRDPRLDTPSGSSMTPTDAEYRNPHYRNPHFDIPGGVIDVPEGLDPRDMSFEPPGSNQSPCETEKRIPTGANPCPTDAEYRAPSVTLGDVQAAIAYESYQRIPYTNVTICCLILQNGFAVVGEAHCVSADNYDREIGQKLAYEAAESKVWGFLGYALKDRLYRQAQGKPGR